MSSDAIDFGDDQIKTTEIAYPLFARLRGEGIEPGFITSEIFQDDKLNDSFLKLLSPEEQYQYLKNTSLFEAKLKKDRWRSAAGESNTIFGHEITAPITQKENGEQRPAETGRSILVERLRESGIDPSQVLIFRATQSGDSPKPELYWTTDYFETSKGLTTEMGEAKKTAVILVSSLEKVCQGGAIEDVNDDNGLPIRRIDSSPFDQKSTLGIIK